jgi:nicotinate-nucleotide pyrophosphorylase (carboxylating)
MNDFKHGLLAARSNPTGTNPRFEAAVTAPLRWDIVDPIIERALEEDLGTGDVTTDSIIAADRTGEGRILAHSEGVVAGLPVFYRVFRILDPNAELRETAQDGFRVAAGGLLGTVRGSVRTLLKGERTALNFLQRLSGIATRTDAFVRAVEGTGCVILDTRKTTPTMRELEKYAVRAGGGRNHRFGLFDMVLIKNNHADAAGGVSTAIERCLNVLRQRGLEMKVEVEARNLEEVLEAIRFPVDRILLDNMSPAAMQEAVELIGGRAETEASGGIRLENVREAAETGVRFISVGSLTHSAPAMDISFRITVGGSG